MTQANPRERSPVVIDASVLIAGLMANGRARTVILHTDHPLLAPPFIQEEVHERVDKIADRANLPPAVVTSVLEDLGQEIQIVPGIVIDKHLPRALELVESADATGDEDYVALALALEAPVWTYDDDFDRIPEVRTIGTSAIEKTSL